MSTMVDTISNQNLEPILKKTILARYGPFYFRPFHNHNSITKPKEALMFVLGIRNRGCRMVSTD